MSSYFKAFIVNCNSLVQRSKVDNDVKVSDETHWSLVLIFRWSFRELFYINGFFWSYRCGLGTRGDSCEDIPDVCNVFNPCSTMGACRNYFGTAYCSCQISMYKDVMYTEWCYPRGIFFKIFFNTKLHILIFIQKSPATVDFMVFYYI